MKKKMAIVMLLLTTLVMFNSCSNELTSSIENEEIVVDDAEDRGISGFSDSQVNSDILNYLNRWKNDYYKVKNGYGYIQMAGQGNIATEEISTSEAMGYGLRLLNYKYRLDGNGHDYVLSVRDLRKTVDAFDFSHPDDGKRYNTPVPEEIGSGLNYKSVNWYVPANLSREVVDNDPEAGPATDGDLDIAYGLILADRTISEISRSLPSYAVSQRRFYDGQSSASRQLALELIRGIAINYYGTATVNGETRNYLTIAPCGKFQWEDAAPLTRPSDWMPHHLKTFIDYYKDFGPSAGKSEFIQHLQNLLDGTLKMILDNKWGGAFPDFIKFENNGYRPLTATGADRTLFSQLGEEIVPNHYSWNACRVPWRIAEYFQLTGNRSGTYEGQMEYLRMRDMIGRITYGFLKSGNVSVMGSEYDLSFNKVNSTFNHAFAGPVAAAYRSKYVVNRATYLAKRAVMIENYNILKNKFTGHGSGHADGYYEDSINAFSLLLMAGIMPKAY